MTADNDWNLIYSYTRAQAIADGVLVDVTDAAKDVGFKVHTAVSEHLYHGYVEPPDGLTGEGQSVTGRLHDLLFLVLCSAKKSHPGADRATVRVAFLMDNVAKKNQPLALALQDVKAVPRRVTRRSLGGNPRKNRCPGLERRDFPGGSIRGQRRLGTREHERRRNRSNK